MKRLTLALVACLLPLGCDLDQILSDASEKKTDAKKDAKKDASQTDPEVGEATKPLPSPTAECVAACDADTSLSTTDRATCRLNCEQPSKAGASVGEAAIRKFSACSDACDAKSETDAETCRLNCAGKTAASLKARDPDASAEQQRCTTACLEDISVCRTACGEGDAGATCKLRCESEAQRCVGSCQ